MNGRTLEALLRLRQRREAEAGATLARSLEAARAEGQALAPIRAGLERLEERLMRVPASDLAEPLLAGRFRERIRDERARLSAARAAQQARVASAEAVAEGARGAWAAARAERRGAQARLERWLAGRRSAREEAEEREREDTASHRRRGLAPAGEARQEGGAEGLP